jgi:CubicO group peptidase (beta-lactamase class C family)
MRSLTCCAIFCSLIAAAGSAISATAPEPPAPKLPTHPAPAVAVKAADKPAPESNSPPTGKPAAAQPSATPPATHVEPVSPPRASAPTVAAQAAAKPHPVGNAEDLEAFFDGALRVQLESKHIAGAVVAVVVGDKLVFTKGYGYADVEKQLPVDPQTTMFRIASVTKLFTWTSAMQLVEEGKLDPDADINTYLKGTGVQIPAAFGKPITLKDLMTHTPGFEDRPVGLFAHSAAEMKPLAEVLKSDMPARVRPPGVVASYSNYGSALAGLAVATVAGKTWEDVVEERLLVPLGMKYTLARQPDALKLPATVSKAYKWSDGRFKEESFEYVPLSPAGAISASAADMSHFLIAHLNDGKYGDVRILKPETARRMRERLFAHDPKVDAMCYGFWELNRNGQRILHHGGDTLLFHTLFAMIPEQKVGLFLSYNTDRAGGAREEVLDAFLDRYFPGPPEPRSRTTTADVASLKRFEGEYSGSRHSETTYAKLVLLLQPFTVHANDNGTLTAGFRGEPRRYVPEGPLVFRELDGRRKLLFHEDEQGNISQVYMADVPAAAMIRETGVNQPRYHQGLVAVCGLMFLSAFLFWPVLAFTRRGAKSTRFRRSFLSGLISLVGWLLSAAALIFLGALVWGLREPEQVVYGTPRELEYALLVPQVCVGLAGIALLGSIVAWSRGYWRFSGRVHYSLVAFAGLGFAWFLFYWNLLQFGADLLITKS